MAINVSQELFNALVKASNSEKKAGFDDCGVWIDWDFNNGLLKGNFTIPIVKSVSGTEPSLKIDAKDFLNYEGK